MAEWEYLLQKEGDRSWLPLKSPRMEIPEGRYRIVAHSNRANTDVELRITHYCIDEVPPKRRFQKRSHRTNAEGLMVVIPFTYIKPGLWDLLVKNEIMSDLLGDTWQEGIQLQVLPKVPQTHNLPVHLDETTKANRGSSSVGQASGDSALPIPPSPVKAEIPTPTPTPKEQIAIPLKPLVGLDLETTQLSRRTEKKATSVPSDELAGLAQPEQTTGSVNDILADSLQVAEQVFQQLVDPVQLEAETTPDDQSIDTGNGTPRRHNSDEHVGASASLQPQKTAWLPTGNNQDAQTEDSSLLAACASVNPPALLLSLDQETLVAHRGQSLQMTGRVDVPDTTATDSLAIESNLNLRYQLRDPQNGQVLVSEQISLPKQVPPYAFSVTLALPPNCETRLILGEVTLCDARGMFIATRPFSITADLLELLGTIVQKPQAAPTDQTPGAADSWLQANQPELLPETSSGRHEEAINLDLYFLNLIDGVKNPQSFQRATGQLLPPQIKLAPATKKVSKSPKLPKLPSVRLSGAPSLTDALDKHDSLCIQATPPEGSKDEARSISQELVDSNSTHPHLTSELKETLAANDHNEVLSDVWDLPPTEKSQVVSVEADNVPEAEVDFGWESTDGEQKVTDLANSVDLGAGSNLGKVTVTPQQQVPTGEQLKLEKLEMIEVISGSEQPPSYLPESPLPVPSASGVVDVSTDARRSLTKLPTRGEDQGEFLSPLIPSNWQEDWAEFLPTSVPAIREEDRQELLSGDEQQESQNPKLLEEQVEPELEMQQLSKEEAAPVESPVDQAFQALRMEERFWWRLNTMATDIDLSEWIRSEHFLNSLGEIDLAIDELPPDKELETLKVDALQPLPLDTTKLLTGTNGALLADVAGFEGNFSPHPSLPTTQLAKSSKDEQVQSTPDLSGESAEDQKLVQSTELPSEDSLHPETTDAVASLSKSPSQKAQNQSRLSLNDVGLDWNTQEIVVDDELPAPSPSAQTNPTSRVDDSYSSEPLAIFHPFEEELVPTPELNVRGGELTCGELLTLRVKLPPYQNPIYVKLWIQDRQSHSLLDGPRLLKDFSTNASGELEAIAQLNVPFGSLSVRFEAIAINMYTQRESHKVMVDRSVVPPDIPMISLDEFED